MIRECTDADIDATLIRHAYVPTSQQGRGIGGNLLRFLITRVPHPLVGGTWAAATWAILISA